MRVCRRNRRPENQRAVAELFLVAPSRNSTTIGKNLPQKYLPRCYTGEADNEKEENNHE